MLSWKLLSVAGALVLTAAVAPTAAAQDSVKVEIAVGKSVASNMPADTASTFTADVGSLVCWTRVSGAAGSKITHVWTHGSDSASVELTIGGSPWRTYSKKTIPAKSTGDWKVEVKDANGKVIATKTFTIGG